MTKPMQAEVGLRECERRLQFVLDAAKLRAWTFDVETLRLDMPPATQELFGLLGKPSRLGPLRRCLHPDDRPQVEHMLRAVVGGKGDFNASFRIRQQSGAARWLDAYAVLVQDDGGPRLYGVCADVTARKRDERRQHESDERLKLALNAARMGTWRQDLKSQRVTVDAKFRELIGFSADELIDIASWRNRIVPEDRSVAMLAFARAVHERLPHNTEYRVIGRDDSRRWISSQAIILYDADGEASAACGVVGDITEQKKQEQQHRRREHEFKTLVENSPDIVSRLDRSFRHLYINRAAETFFGIGPERFIGRTVEDLRLPREVVDATTATAAAAFESGIEQSTSFSVERGEQRSHYFMRAIPEADSTGITASVLLIINDVTERANVQTERDQLLEREYVARKQAEEAARARDQFLAIVSHELRSPLNGIQNWSHVLESQIKTPSPSIQRAISGIRFGIEQQVRLIDDLLDATRIMSGKLSLMRQPVTVLPIVKAAIDSVSAAATAKHIEIESHCEIENEQVDGDADRLQQIFWNLLSNAVKFTPVDGRVRVTASRLEDAVLVVVHDNGKGISPSFLPYMFEWFRRDETANSRSQDGLGLGLALVRHLCELHGGSVSAQSSGDGKGATFTVRLPLRTTLRSTVPQSLQPESYPEASLMSLAGLRVLLIDDQAETRESLSALLEYVGARPIAMPSGESARRWIERCGPADAPHVLLCDIAMPGEDGYTTLQKIRARETAMGVPAGSRIPAIALTALAQREDRIRALTAGFQMHMNKPVAPEELIVVIATMAGRPAGIPGLLARGK